MAPTIILIRHAQALHNLTQDYSIPDPLLTEEGVQQCSPLRESLLQRYSHVKPEDVAIISSPMRRTLQTTQLALDWLINKGVKIEPDAGWQENSSKPCDTGSFIIELTEEFPTVDFSSVYPDFPDKTSQSESARFFHYTRDAILARGRHCLASLSSRPEKLIFVVSHSGFLRLGVVGWWFFNADYRIFEFDGSEVTGTGHPRLRQHEETTAGGLGLSRAEPVELGEGLPDDPLDLVVW